MKSLTIALLASTLAGCSGLNVTWAATATYNTPATTTTTMTPGQKEKESQKPEAVKPVEVKPAP